MSDGAIWITGASSGIGEALVHGYAGQGRRVIATARRAERLQALAEQYPGLVRAVPCDVTDHAALQVAMADCGPIDRVILNAGTYVVERAADLDPATFRQVIDLNIMGQINPLAVVLPAMRAAGRGQIAIVSSLAGYRGLPKSLSYGASKAAMINLAEALQIELKPDGIDVRLITPGFIKTPLTDRNDFPMPFLMPVDACADAIMRGLNGRSFEISPPRRFTFWLRRLRCLPTSWYFWLVERSLQTNRK